MHDEYFDIARAGLQALVEDRGEDAKFPFDAIWGYTTADVPGPRKPHQARRLMEAQYLGAPG